MTEEAHKVLEREITRLRRDIKRLELLREAGADEILELAGRVLGGEAGRFLVADVPALGGRPADIILDEGEEGRNRVEEHLLRVDHGVYA